LDKADCLQISYAESEFGLLSKSQGNTMNLRSWIVAAMLAFGLSCSFAAPPATLAYQGRLTQNGLPVNINVSLTFALYSVAGNGSPLWSETQNIPVTNGLYSAILGQSTPFPAGLFDGPLWLGVTAGTDPEMLPRQQMTSTAYSQHAATADALTTIPTICANGQLAQGINSDGNAVGCTPMSAAGVTSITAGT
jgi:hypothetical protein